MREIDNKVLIKSKFKLPYGTNLGSKWGFKLSNSTTKDKKFNKHLPIILLIMFTETLGFSIVLPVLPHLGLSLGLNFFQIGLISSIFSFCQLFASPITGKLSDRFGRKPILIFSQSSTFLGFLLLGMVDTVWILILARLVDGLLGSNMTVTQAYLSDVTDPKDRTKTFGYSSAVFGAALIFGPVIGGTLSSINYSIPMFFAAGISLISIILVIIFLQESLTIKKEKFNLKFEEIIPIKETKRFFKSTEIKGLLIIFFIYNFAFMIFISSFALLAKIQLDVNSQELGFYLAWVGILRVIFQSALITPLLKKINENNTLKIGVLALVITMISLVLITNFWIVFIPLIFLAFGSGVVRPILTSKLSKSVGKEETGSLLGVNNSFSSIAQILSPILGGLILEFLPSQTLPAISAVLFLLIFVFWRFGFTKPIQVEATSPVKYEKKNL
ncbi:MAG: MFS transporter [Candidatus Lokiarchaeota archaeon]|nr:MFS transporter [Candidatus Lokiarchaeota archaeon]